jgi:hypothetical protein
MAPLSSPGKLRIKQATLNPSLLTIHLHFVLNKAAAQWNIDLVACLQKVLNLKKW